MSKTIKELKEIEEIRKEFEKNWYLWSKDKQGNYTTCGEEVWSWIESAIARAKEEERERITKDMIKFLSTPSNKKSNDTKE